MLVKVKRIQLYAGTKPPVVGLIYINPDYVKYVEQKDVEKLQLNGWNIPNDVLPLYEVEIADEADTVYTDEDGFLNLTAKGNK